VTKHMVNSLAGDIGLIVDTYHYDQKYHTNFLEIVKDNLIFDLDILDKNNTKHTKSFDVDNERLNGLLDQQIIYPYDIKLINDESEINIHIYMEDKDLSITTTAKRIYNPTTSIFIFWIIGT